jgi:NADH-quinone oxidoreductase subunit N
LAVFVKSTLFFYFLRLVFFVFFPLFGSFFRYLFLCVGLLSLVIGAFGGLAQKKIKRLFAYSSLTNMGFLFIILSAVEPNFLLLTVRAGGLFYVVTYALGYFLTMVIVFTILLFFFESANGLNLRYITDLQLLRYTYGKWGILLACCLFSLAGVPPFPGFFLKFYGLVNIGSSIFHYVLLGTALLTTVSTFYYMRLIKIMYFDNLNIEHLQYFDYNFSKNEIIFSGTQDSYSALINSFKNYITFERFLYSILILVFSIFTYSILLTGY